MATGDPFSEQHSYHQPTNTPPMRSGKNVMAMLVIVGTVAMVFCGGFGVLAFFAVQKIAGTSVDVELPSRKNAIEADRADFNRSLGNPCIEPCGDVDIHDFVLETVDVLESGEDPAFSSSVFIEAVAKSEWSRGSLGFADRLMIRNWISEYQPTPAWLTGYGRILEIRLHPDNKRATVDLISYSEEDLAECHQWFLVKEGTDWKLYDWQILEDGRRMSDEYAGYLRGVSPRSEGYDVVMGKLGQVTEMWADGDEQGVDQLLKTCERTPMLAADHPVAMLHVAYSWMAIGKHEEAIRLLEGLGNHDHMWGIWPALAACYLNEGEYEQALKFTLKAEEQSPNHPNVQWLFSKIYPEMNREDEAADAAIATLRICQEDTAVLGDVISYQRPQDIPVLLDTLNSFDSDDGWSRLISTASYSTEWAVALFEQISQRDDLPLGLKDLAAGEVALSQDDDDAAAKHFLLAQKNAQSPTLKATATDEHFHLRLYGERFAELFAESTDIDATIETLVRLAMEDELYCDTATLLNAAEQIPEIAQKPWARGLIGWSHFSLGQYEQALPHLEAFGESLTDEANIDEDDDWIFDACQYYITQSLLDLDRPLDALARWPSDLDRHEQIVGHLLNHHNDAVVDEFLKATADNPTDSVRLQRLRLEAAVQMRAGNPEQCDLRHQQAIELAQTVYSEQQSYLLDNLVRRRAADLVWNRLAADEIDTSDGEQNDSAGRELLVTAAVREAIRLRDSAAVDAWLRSADQWGIVAGDTYANLQQQLGEYQQSQGEWQKAIEATRNSIREATEKDDWNYQRLQDQLLIMLLTTNRLDDARQLLADQDLDGSMIPGDATIALAKGDFETLAAMLGEFDEQTVLTWLDETFHRRLLAAQSDDPKTLELLEKYPQRITYQSTQADGRLLLDKDARFDAPAVQQLLTESLNERFELQAVPLVESSDKSEVWKGTSDAGQQVLVGWSLVEYETEQLSELLATELSQPVSQLTIAIVDDQPYATKRLFEVAATAAASGGIAFSWSEESRIWVGPNLNEQLAWKDRVPVRSELRHVWLVRKVDTQEDESEYVSVQQWAEKLQDSDGPLPVVLSQSVSQWSEAIPGELVRAEADNYVLIVRPKVNSVINPQIRVGLPYRASPSFVSETIND